jgi:hypothetical protein
MDAADSAQQQMEQLEKLRRQQKPPMVAEPKGYCLNCGNTDIKKGLRWCDVDCRTDWQRRNE